MLTDFGFHDVGLVPHSEEIYGDVDRLPPTIDDALVGAFKTPTLRCAAGHPSFMHTGQMTALADVAAVAISSRAAAAAARRAVDRPRS